jgi:hypothetical protein
MKIFKCPACSQALFFENGACENCGRRLGYLPDGNSMSSLEPNGDEWTSNGDGQTYRFCRNADYGCCNWLIPARSSDLFCLACRHNEIVPDLSIETNVELWRKIETAKHRLYYSLLRLGLPVRTRQEYSEGLVFDFLNDQFPGAPNVMTSHDTGRITIALAEADDAEREKRRTTMREPYRTLLGHFRHEIGHYYWNCLVRDGSRLEECREIFGDERQDYNAALHGHYVQGAPSDWQASFVSAYATTHPWEDFAETWAHYFHIVDTLEMAASFGLNVQAATQPKHSADMRGDFDPYVAKSASELVAFWLPLTIALNSVNRCMGQNDLYPFILTSTITRKLEFIHQLMRPAEFETSRAQNSQGESNKRLMARAD